MLGLLIFTLMFYNNSDVFFIVFGENMGVGCMVHMGSCKWSFCLKNNMFQMNEILRGYEVFHKIFKINVVNFMNIAHIFIQEDIKVRMINFNYFQYYSYVSVTLKLSNVWLILIIPNTTHTSVLP